MAEAAEAPVPIYIGSDCSEASWAVSVENAASSDSETGDSWENVAPHSELGRDEEIEPETDGNQPPPPPPAPEVRATPRPVPAPERRDGAWDAPRAAHVWDPYMRFLYEELRVLFQIQTLLHIGVLVLMLLVLWRTSIAPNTEEPASPLTSATRCPGEETMCPDVMRLLAERDQSHQDRLSSLMDAFDSLRKEDKQKCESKCTVEELELLRQDLLACQSNAAAAYKRLTDLEEEPQPRRACDGSDCESRYSQLNEILQESETLRREENAYWKQKYEDLRLSLAQADEATAKARQETKLKEREKEELLQQVKVKDKELRSATQRLREREEAMKQGHPWWCNQVEGIRQRVKEEWERHAESHARPSEWGGRFREFWERAHHQGQEAACRFARRIGAEPPECDYFRQ